MLCLSGFELYSRWVPLNRDLKTARTKSSPGGRGGGYSHTLPIRVCAAQRGRDFEAPGHGVSISEEFSTTGYKISNA